MKKMIFIQLLVVLAIGTLHSQSLPVPRNLQKGYTLGTRSLTGEPGSKYWQNKAFYKLKANFDPATRLLTGEAEIVYQNNSPDTLKEIVFGVKQDLFRKGEARNTAVAAADVHDGVTLSQVLVNGVPVSEEKIFRQSTLGQVPALIPPGGSAKLEVQWSFTHPFEQKLRFGTYDSASFFIAYWYPQICVYDDLGKWNRYPMDGEHEFFNEFADYDVSITVPSEYAVWASGSLLNGEQTLRSEILKRIEKMMSQDASVIIAEKSEFIKKQVTITDKPTLTWKFKSENCNDFAFALSSSYRWEAVRALCDAQTGRYVPINVVYNEKAEPFYEVAKLAKESIEYYSSVLPAVPYPFPVMTVFHGMEGMEFPMMCNNEAFETRDINVYVTSHEIGHTYFPFYVGINEFKYSWMEEGWATMLPYELQNQQEPALDARIWNATALSRYGGTESEMPLIVPSFQLRGYTHQLAAYSRSSLMYYYLREYLGHERFIKALHHYMNLWKQKHPTPYDFVHCIETSSGEQLGWYWNPWVREFTNADLKIENAESKNGECRVTVRKVGGLPVPVVVTVACKDGSESTERHTAGVWKDKDIFEVTIPVKSEAVTVKIGSLQIPDTNPADNSFSLQ